MCYPAKKEHVPRIISNNWLNASLSDQTIDLSQNFIVKYCKWFIWRPFLELSHRKSINLRSIAGSYLSWTPILEESDKLVFDLGQQDHIVEGVQFEVGLEILAEVELIQVL